MGCLSSSIIYSETGDGKTGLLGSLAMWSKMRTGKKMRLYTSEPDTGTIDHLIGEFIDVAITKDRGNACETISLAAHGWWPNAKTGEWEPTATAVWEKEIGFVAYEGGTEFGNDILGELRTKGAEGSIISAEKAPAQFISGKLKVAGNNQTHYGIAQGRLKEAINNSQKLPVHIAWTARMLKVVDNASEGGGVFDKQFVYGPLLAGKAATADVPAWFGNCIHVDMVKAGVDPKTKLDIMERRAYLRKHFDEGSTTPYPAKLRVPPEFEHEVPPYIVLTSDLMGGVRLFDMIDELKAKAKQKAIASLSKSV